MANTEKQENVIQEVKTEETTTQVPVEKQEEPKVTFKAVEQEGGNFKINPKIVKTEEKQEESPKELVKEKQEEEVKVEQEESILQEVTEEEIAETQKAEAEQKNKVVDEVPPQQPDVVVPENLQDLVEFMKDTGGSLEDYVRLNADYSNIDENSLLREYYKNTKPHLDIEEINFLIEDNFLVDEDLDEPRDIKKKKLAFKEEIVKARKHLTGLKDQYYKEVKLGSKLTSEQKEAVEFYNKYNQEQTANSEIQKRQAEHFKKSTDGFFNNNFKGFDFNVGEKTYRYGVNNVEDVKNYQSDLYNFVGEFLDENSMMKNARGYHKALYAGKNIDKIVKHFYYQGKADAIKEASVSAKNIDMSPRAAAKPVVETGGMKFKVLGGDDSSGLKFKIKNK